MLVELYSCFHAPKNSRVMWHITYFHILFPANLPQQRLKVVGETGLAELSRRLTGRRANIGVRSQLFIITNIHFKLFEIRWRSCWACWTWLLRPERGRGLANCWLSLRRRCLWSTSRWLYTIITVTDSVMQSVSHTHIFIHRSWKEYLLKRNVITWPCALADKPHVPQLFLLLPLHIVSAKCSLFDRRWWNTSFQSISSIVTQRCVEIISSFQINCPFHIFWPYFVEDQISFVPQFIV